MMSAVFRTVYEELFRQEEWNIGIVREPITAFLDPSTKHTVSWLPSVGGMKYLADPFGVAMGEELYVFCEEYDYRTRKGRIVCIEVTPEGVASRPVVALELSHHMSYPYLLEDDGEIYCVPETGDAKEIGLYKSTDFPYEWRKIATLIDDFAGRDTTIFRHEDLLWLASFEDYETSCKLLLWYSSSLFGPWVAHAANPVKTDLGSSRPAGTPFTHEGYLFRPAQDCSVTYGGRIVLNRVKKLTPTEFTEERAAVIEPSSNGPYPDGLHTISTVGNITLIDGKRYMSQKSTFKNAFIRAVTYLAR
ncbi:hypothetical protein MUP79_07315 [Candidatus Bathyarchaeota archaeon]|nr:hypothetical protein [Candidatus Bathyarchaeota archaeon]